jgi:hypothetical protein
MKNVFLFLLGLLLGCSLSLFKVHTTNNVSSEFVTKYKFKGRVDQNSKFNFMLYDSIYRSVYQSTTNTVSFIPKSIEDSGVIKNEITASKIAYIIVSDVYGRDCADGEQPYEITLINNREWHVNGTLPPNYEGGTFTMVLDKKNGSLLEIRHEK